MHGLDGGEGCPPPLVFDPTDGGSLTLVLTACPTDGSVFIDSDTAITVLTADGGPLDTDDCDACYRCPGAAICERGRQNDEIVAGTFRHVWGRFDGRRGNGRSTCAGTAFTCEVREPLHPQTLTVRFCVARQEPTDAGAETLDCRNVAVEVPLAVGGVEARFR